MPKQRRTSSSKPVAKKKPAASVHPKRHAAARPARSAPPASRRRGTAKPPSKKPTAKAATKPVVRRAPMKGHQPAAPVAVVSHERAVGTFERGFKALQQRQYDRAASAFRAVVAGFPDEKEMQERARVYLSICARQAAGAGRPRSFEERMNAATVSINRGAFDDALRLLRDLASDHPQSDYVQYLLTVAHTSTGDVEKALSHLRRAIELNPENKLLSAADADLEPLRQHSGFLATLDPPSALSAHRRTGARKR